MKISLSWIRRYAAIEATPAEIENALTLIGFEVEGIERVGLPPLDQVVVGEVKDRVQHPNADRLGVCQVDVGDGTLRQIVCGASNYVVGDRVPVALPGALLPGDFKIKVSKLRGVESQGMMCSPRELGLGDDHEGLMILDLPTELGQPINQVFPENDWVFDVEVTPNRPDCLSHLGMARELAAYFRVSLVYPEVFSPEIPEVAEGFASILKKVTVEASEQCPLYQGYLISGVKIGPSPRWLAKALEAIGLRPINNVVDVTNYVLFELGQPLHAFDAAKIGGRELVIRQAKDGEILTTLDGKKRTLDASMTVIADAERPLVIAGVMGSEEAEVDDTTVDLVLEAAYFEPTAIRRTSRRLALSTDSSYRFERGVDPTQVHFAALRAIDLIRETAGGTFTGPVFSVGKIPPIATEIEISPEFILERLGFGPEPEVMKQVFQSLEMNVKENGPGASERWSVDIPSFRGDLERPIDLVEEFLRVYGTDKIPAASMTGNAVPGEDSGMYQFSRDALNLLARRGYQEAVNYSLRSPAELESWLGQSAPEALRLENPLTQDQTHLRTSLLPGLLDVLRTNLNHGTGYSRFSESGRVYRLSDADGQLFEICSIAFVQWLPEEDEQWLKRSAPDFFTVKNELLGLAELAGIDRSAASASFVALDDAAAWQTGHAGSSGSWEQAGLLAGGFVSLGLLKTWDIPGLVLAGEILILPERLDKPARKPSYQPVSHHPLSFKDLALLVDSDLPAAKVEVEVASLAAKAAGDLLQVSGVSVFDVYAGKGLPENKKSLAFRIAYRKEGGTPGEKELTTAFQGLRDLLAANSPYEVRGA